MSQGRREGSSPLAGVPPEITTAADGTRDGMRIIERGPSLALQVIARRGQAARVREAMQRALGIELPVTPGWVAAGDVAVLWSGPDQWIMMAPIGQSDAVADKLAAAMGGIAALVDQSDSRVQLGIAGPRVRDALAKLIAIDIDATVFPVGAAAMTVIAHIPVHVWRGPDAGGASSFEIAGPQSYAASLWHHVIEAAAEYGIEAKPHQAAAKPA